MARKVYLDERSFVSGKPNEQGYDNIFDLNAHIQKVVDASETTFDSIATDVISEKTAAAGVTIDGVLLKDSTVKTDTIVEKTATAGVTVDGVLLKDGLVNRAVDAVTTTGVTQTLPCGYNDLIVLTSTTGTDIADLSNSAINDGHIVTLVYAAEAAGADEITVSKLNASDGLGFTTITFSTVGDTIILQWIGDVSAWVVLGGTATVA